MGGVGFDLIELNLLCFRIWIIDLDLSLDLDLDLDWIFIFSLDLDLIDWVKFVLIVLDLDLDFKFEFEFQIGFGFGFGFVFNISCKVFPRNLALLEVSLVALSLQILFILSFSHSYHHSHPLIQFFLPSMPSPTWFPNSLVRGLLLQLLSKLREKRFFFVLFVVFVVLCFMFCVCCMYCACEMFCLVWCGWFDIWFGNHSLWFGNHSVSTDLKS